MRAEIAGWKLARPDLPRPRCRVRLICGPPAAGKTTYVRAHAAPDDIVIDLDEIAREHGFARHRPASITAPLLEERNARLAALANEPPQRVAWFIICAPSASLRRWWADMLDVLPDDVIVLTPPEDELRRRIMADPEREYVRSLHLGLVAQWYAHERRDDPGTINGGFDLDGFPTDPLHPWNRNALQRTQVIEDSLRALPPLWRF